MEDDPEVRSTGCIIDSPGSISQGKSGYDVVNHAVAEFSGITVLASRMPMLMSSSECHLGSWIGTTLQRHDETIW